MQKSALKFNITLDFFKTGIYNSFRKVVFAISVFEKFEKDFYAQISSHAKWPVDPLITTPHFHDGYELYCLYSGSTKYIIEQTTYEVDEGDIVWIPPYTDHKTLPNKTERHKRLLIWTLAPYLESCLKNSKELAEFYRHHRVIKTTPREVQIFKKITNLLLMEYFSKQHANRETIMSGMLVSLLTFVKHTYERNNKDYNIRQTSSSNDSKYIPNMLMSYIDSHFSEDISLTDLAEQVNMNPSYVSSLFKRSFGFTFKEYLVKLRIEKAKQLLKSTNSTVESIAQECGFRSINLFCKTFKNSVGISPMMFRNIDDE